MIAQIPGHCSTSPLQEFITNTPPPPSNSTGECPPTICCLLAEHLGLQDPSMQAATFSPSDQLAFLYLIFAILNYSNLEFVLSFTFILLNFCLYFILLNCLILTDAEPTCLECPQGRMEVFRDK